MQNVVKELEAFVSRASDASAERPAPLLDDISNIFLAAGSSFSAIQLDKLGRIMERLAYEQPVEIRASLAKKIAEEAHAPHKLVVRMAADDITVAECILSKSPVLMVSDLLVVASAKDQPYLQAIAVRPSVQALVSDVLIQRGDVDTVVTLLQNTGAMISETGVTEIVRRAAKETLLQNALIEREDISNDNLTSAYFVFDDKLKAKLVGAWGDLPVRDLEADPDSSEFRQASARFAIVEERIEGLRRNGTLDEVRLAQFARNAQPLEFLIALARLAKIDVHTARKCVDDQSGKSLMMACKACGFSLPTFKSIMMSPLSCVPASPSNILPLVTQFRALDKADAMRVLEFWRSRH